MTDIVFRGPAITKVGWTDAAIVELNGYFNFSQRQPKKTFTLLIATLRELCKRPVIPAWPHCRSFPANFRELPCAVFRLVFIHASRTRLLGSVHYPCPNPNPPPTPNQRLHSLIIASRVKYSITV